MANTVIQLKYSNVTGTPPLLNVSEPAYSNVSNKLWINDGDGVVAIGGKYYTQLIDAATANDTANTLVRRDTSGNFSSNTITANSAIINGYDIYTFANSAFAAANTAQIAGGQIAGGYANSAYLHANSAYESQNTTGVYANSAYAQSNTATQYAQSAGDYANSAYLQANTGTQYATSAGVYANSAYAQANSAQAHADAGYALANTKLSSSGGTIAGDLAVTGNLTVSGNTFHLDVTTLNVSDPIIYLAANNYTSDSVDIGFAGNYFDGSSQRHAGLVRKESSNTFYLFTNYDEEFDNNLLNIANPSLVQATLHANVSANSVIVRSVDVLDRANSAYNQANTGTQYATSAGVYANSAYNQANTGTQYAQSAGSYANSAYAQANTATTDASTADQKAVSAGSYANSAYLQANTGTQYATSAGDYANSAYVQANTGTQYALSAGSYANSAYLQANSAQAHADAGYNQANTATTNASTADQKAVSAGVYANSAYNQANTATTNAATAQTHADAGYNQANTATQYAQAAGSYANGAFDLANTRFSSSGGTISGSVSITGDLVVSGNTVTVNTETIDVQDSLIKLANNNLSDVLDIGFYGQYDETGAKFTGLIRDASDGIFKLFTGEETDPTGNVVSYGAGNRATLDANFTGGNVSGLFNAISVSDGGLGVKTLTANSVVLGNGTDGVLTVGSTTEGHILTISASGAPTFQHLNGGTF